MYQENIKGSTLSAIYHSFKNQVKTWEVRSIKDKVREDAFPSPFIPEQWKPGAAGAVPAPPPDTRTEAEREEEKWEEMLRRWWAVTQEKPMDAWPRPHVKKIARKVRDVGMNRIAKVAEKIRVDLVGEALDEEAVTKMSGLMMAIQCTAAEYYGAKIDTEPRGKPRKGHKPWWQKRMEQKVAKLRTQISQLTEWGRATKTAAGPGAKLREKVKAVAQERGYAMENQKLEWLMESLKIELQGYAARLAFYVDGIRRRKDEELFATSQKAFFRRMRVGQVSAAAGSNVKLEAVRAFWESIWTESDDERAEEEEEDPEWMKAVEERFAEVKEPSVGKVTLENLRERASEMANWKMPGRDGIYAYTFKYCEALLPVWVDIYNGVLQGSINWPPPLLEGTTILLPKVDEPTAADFRPINLLCSAYKLLTRILHVDLQAHMKEILESNQGCGRADARAVQDQIATDATVVTEAYEAGRHLTVTWFDFRKAYDSLSHKKLLRVLRMSRVPAPIVALIEQMMAGWGTKIVFGGEKSSFINICKGIFQGDTMSPDLFLIGINVLSIVLNSREDLAYRAGNHTASRPELGQSVSHLGYMDDFKTYANSAASAEAQEELVRSVGGWLGLEVNAGKSARLTIDEGGIEFDGGETQSKDSISHLAPDQSYKYLGAWQRRTIDEDAVKTATREELLRRTRRIWATKISSRNKIHAFNTFAMPLLAAKVALVRWKRSELEALDLEVRRILRRGRAYLGNTATDWLYTARVLGGRGLDSAVMIYEREVLSLEGYLDDLPDNSFLKKVDVVSPGCTFAARIRLMACTIRESWNVGSTEEVPGAWLAARQARLEKMPSQKRWIKVLNDEQIDAAATRSWMEKKDMGASTEALIYGIRANSIVQTRSFQAKIGKCETAQCRFCGKHEETAAHIASGCTVFSFSRYLNRHDRVCRAIYWSILGRIGANRSNVWSRQHCPPHLRWAGHHVIWNQSWTVVQKTSGRKPDIVWIKPDGSRVVLEISCPGDHRVSATRNEKREKYVPFVADQKRVSGKGVDFMPVIIGCTGAVPDETEAVLKRLDAEVELSWLQKISATATVQLFRDLIL